MYPQKVPAVVPGTVHWFWSDFANFLVPGLTLRKILLFRYETEITIIVVYKII